MLFPLLDIEGTIEPRGEFLANFLDGRLNNIVHLCDFQGRYLEVLHAMIISPMFCVLLQNLSFLFKIRLITNQHHSVFLVSIHGDVVIVPVLDSLGL